MKNQQTMLSFNIILLLCALCSQALGVAWRSDVDEAILIEKAKPFTCVVEIKTHRSHGTGVLIGERTVLTVGHVLEGADPSVLEITAIDERGRAEIYSAVSAHILPNAGKEGQRWLDLGIIGLSEPVDSSRFSIAELDHEYADTYDISPYFNINLSMELEGVGYGMSGASNRPMMSSHGIRRYYQTKASFVFDFDDVSQSLDPHQVVLASITSFLHLETLLPLHGITMPGDSGSPVFRVDSGTGKRSLLAIAASSSIPNAHSDPYLLMTHQEYAHFSYLIPLFAHMDWILNTKRMIESSEIERSWAWFYSMFGGVEKEASTFQELTIPEITYDFSQITLNYLFRAIEGGHLVVIRRIIEAQGGVNETRDISGYGLQEPLNYAIDHASDSVVELLLELGGDPNKPNVSGELPLARAMANSRHSVVRLLIDYGAVRPESLVRHDEL